MDLRSNHHAYTKPYFCGMNYFEILDLPVRLQVDKNELRRQYLQLSRRYHPDHHAQSSGEAQEEALEASALLNQAFKTLSNRDETIRYVLQLKGLLVADEKYNLPPEFLMEMMEINESASELEPGDAGISSIEEQLSRLEAELYEPVAGVIENYAEGVSEESSLLLVKDYYFKKKYLDRLRQQLSGML